MLHTVLIAAHAVGSTAAFRVYLGALWLMVLFLVLVVVFDWGMLVTVSRLLFGALTALAIYVGWRGWHALQDLQRRDVGWTGSYLDDVGFTLIALFDGFVIIGALDLGASVWLVVAIGVLGILVGHGAISRMKTLVAA